VIELLRVSIQGGVSRFVWVACILLILDCPRPMFAQPIEIGGGLMLALPQSQFKRNVEGIGGGLNAYLSYAQEEQPFAFGIQLTFINYGSEDTKAVIYGPGNPVDGKVTTSNNILSVHLLTRLQPNVGTLRPYLEGLAGWNHLFTETHLEDEGTGETIQTRTDLDDDAFSYGAGGGVQITLSGPDSLTADESSGTWSLILGARYMFGGKAKYLKEGSITRENGRVVFTTLESTTDLFQFLIGVSYHF
jgi:hypothetical protein